MSALAPPRPSPSPTGLRGPARVVVRQHRSVLWASVAFLVLGAAAMVGTRLLTDRFADQFAATGCSIEDTVHGCGDTVRSYLDDQYLVHTVQSWAGLAFLVLPVLVGAFTAGPLIARELETGTYKLAWSQSVTPARWLTAKLAVPAALLLAGLSVLTAAFTWARARTGSEYSIDWYDTPAFVTTGAAPVAYALLGLGVGALIGLLVRRTVAALSLAALATGAVITVLASVRSALWPLRTTVLGMSADDAAITLPINPWVVRTGQFTSGGERLPVDVCWGMDVEAEQARCMADHHITGMFVDYHPASHFWPLQLVETGILLVLAALALTLAFRLLRRRHG
ncbi:ABC transporter permease subunit [Streptomyces halstedii]|uniref:ABC transporter permease subunit n=1 Tax=Streptomyces TaxID=1883 RepID=UPI0004A96892|nr:ABC transporter permease subunit [Streptomyces sp. NTK 937]KDQ68602.1 hypothetical protein DT87_15850 [Streptomyces sp. NTK 937]WSX36903.1 ABC transporter permease subunit [Streptomyces halstedii]